MKTHRIQAAFARKRDADNLRMERSTAVNRYFDHWGKVTSRFQSWTNPEYYESAEEKFQQSKKQKTKEDNLIVRRKKLQNLLEDEKQQHEKELMDLIIMKNSPQHVSKRRLDGISTDVLEKINRNLRQNNEERKRLELEAKLYSKWRHQQPANSLEFNANDSVTRSGKSTPFDENALFESKSDHQVMAKLNWLDRQIEEQMRREDEIKESEKRNLQLQKETRKHEEALKERQKIRESEIKELRAMQEYHVEELKHREHEISTLQTNEINLKNIFDILQSELSLLLNDREKNNSKLQTAQQSRHNIGKIKMIFRQRSEIYRNELNDDITRLRKIALISTTNNREDEDPILYGLIEKYERQLNEELHNVSLIEAMYESEAKHNLNKWEDLWLHEYEYRKGILIDFLEKRKNMFETKLNEISKQYKQSIEIRDKHVSAIENSNEKLKILIDEASIATAAITRATTEILPSTAGSNRSNTHEDNGRNSRVYKRNFGANWIDNDDKGNSNFLDFTTKKLNDCHLNGIKDEDASIGVSKFGRKKVAWL